MSVRFESQGHTALLALASPATCNAVTPEVRERMHGTRRFVDKQAPEFQ